MLPEIKIPFFFILTLAASALTSAFGAIPLNSPTTDWYAVSYSGTSRTDYLNDQQTGINESDLVGSDAGASPVQTAFYYDYDGISIGFRVRVDGDGGPAGYTGAVWVGLMLDGNTSIDLFAGVINKGSVIQAGFYSPGTGANVSPSTTSIVNGTPLYSEALSGSNYLWTTVTVGPGGNDPVPGGTADIGGDTTTDYFMTWVLPFSQLQAAALTKGFTVTGSTPFKFVVGTSEQANSMNQDLNGTLGNTTSTLTFAALGVESPTSSAGGGVVPEPGTLSCLILAFAVGVGVSRRRSADRSSPSA